MCRWLRVDPVPKAKTWLPGWTMLRQPRACRAPKRRYPRGPSRSSRWGSIWGSAMSAQTPPRTRAPKRRERRERPWADARRNSAVAA